MTQRAGPHEAGKLEKRYTPSASKDSRVVVVAPGGTSANQLLRSSKKAVAIFDKLIPPQDREASAPPLRSAVLFPIAGPKSFESISAAAAREGPSLVGWASAATRGVGFLLEDPLAGAGCSRRRAVKSGTSKTNSSTASRVS